MISLTSKKKDQLIALFLLMNVAVLLICACNVRVSNHSPGSSTISFIANCRVIKHSMGETCVPVNPQRVSTLTPSALGNALALDVKPIASANGELKEGEFPPHLNPRAQGIKTLGTPEQPNIERILYLQPDLIVGWSGLNPQTTYPLLSKIAPTVVYGWQEYTWKEEFNFIAEVLGKQETAQAAWHHYQNRIQALKTAMGDRYKHKKISFIFTYLDTLIVTDVKNSFVGSILSDAGLQRPESQDIIAPSGNIGFSEEELEKADGDVLFVAVSRNSDRHSIERLKRKPLWKKLKAVQQNHVYLVDISTWLSGDMIGANAMIDDLFKYLVNTP